MARSNNGTVSAYAAYEQEKGVKGIGTYVPRELYDLMTAARPNTADGAIIKEALVEFVNARRQPNENLEIAPAYELAGRKESPEAKAKREAKETADKLAKALEELAQLRAEVIKHGDDFHTPTPPAVIADAATGKVHAK